VQLGEIEGRRQIPLEISGAVVVQALSDDALDDRTVLEEDRAGIASGPSDPGTCARFNQAQIRFEGKTLR